jgi:hypothetical protein
LSVRARAFSTLNSATNITGGNRGQLTMLQQDAIDVDPSTAIPTDRSYFNTSGVVKARIFAATNPSSGEVAYQARPNATHTPTYSVPVTTTGTLNLGLESAILGVNLHYRQQHGCMEVWQTFVDYVKKVKPRVVVVVGGGAHLSDPTEAAWEKSADSVTQEDALKHGLHNLVAALGRSSHVIYIRQLPSFETAPSCFLRPIRLPGTKCSPMISRAAVEGETRSFDGILYQLQREIPELELVDSVGALCGAETCAQQLPSGELLYIDEFHLSTAGGRHFAQSSGMVDLIERQIAAHRPSSLVSSDAVH